MDELLGSLIEYEGILGALATTPDGLVVAAAGLNSDDAEIVAAAGTTLQSSLQAHGERGGAMTVSGGTIHMVQGDEISVVLITEESVSYDAVSELMDEALERVAGALA